MPKVTISYERFKSPDTPTIESIAELLKTHINNKAYGSLEATLRNIYHFPETKILREETYTYERDSDSTYGRGYDTCTTYYNDFQTRPLIEALFFDYHSIFREIFSNLPNDTDYVELYSVLRFRLIDTDLSEEMLFGFNSKVKSKVRDYIDELERYGKQLSSEKDFERSEKITKLVKSLNDELDRAPTATDIRSMTVKQRINAMKYKMNFLTILHAEDKHFESHRGWKRVVANIVAAFTFGIAHLIHKKVTGTWLFCNKTTTAEKVSDIQDALGFDGNGDKRINFK